MPILISNGLVVIRQHKHILWHFYDHELQGIVPPPNKVKNETRLI